MKLDGAFSVNGIKVGSTPYEVTVRTDGSVDVGGQEFTYDEFKKLTLKSEVNGDVIGKCFHQKTLFQKYHKQVLALATKLKALSKARGSKLFEGHEVNERRVCDGSQRKR